MTKLNGFTLAEVLITLVVIGVIAAMTIPTLIQSMNKQEYRTGLKKSISTLNEALEMQYALNNDNLSDSSYATPKDVVEKVFAKRLSIIKSNPAGTGDGWPANGYQFYTADGMKMEVYDNKYDCADDGTSRCFWMLIDVNGDKGPNKYTSDSTDPYDIFDAQLFANKVTAYNAAQGIMYESKNNTYSGG